MSTEIVAAKTALDRLNRSLAKTSLDSLVKAKTRRSLVLVDCSGSMSNIVLLTGERRIDALRKTVTTLRETHPVPVASFGGRHTPRLVEVIPEPAGMTPLDAGIRFATIQGASHLVVVTDGEPNSETAAFDAAREFGGPIDVFYIGDGNDHAADFCRRLAEMTGGSVNVTDLGETKQLAGKMAGLLGDGSL